MTAGSGTRVTLWRAATPPGDAVILPDGCMDVIWTGDTLLIAGPDTVPNVFSSAIRRDIVGLRFAPGHAPGLLGHPASRFTDLRVPAADIWPTTRVRRWSDMLAESDDAAATLRTLCAGCTHVGVPLAIDALVSMLGQGVPVADCAEALGVTPRTLHRMSLQSFGYGPKTLARVLRMRAAMRLIGGRPLSDVAADAGYADYSHMHREFSEIAGAPPPAFAVSVKPAGTRQPSGA